MSGIWSRFEGGQFANLCFDFRKDNVIEPFPIKSWQSVMLHPPALHIMCMSQQQMLSELYM